MKEISNFEGHFQVWSYSVSHSQLLLYRVINKDSSMYKKCDTRIDILFSSVAYMQIPSHFNNLKLEEMRADEISVPFQLGIEKMWDRKIFRLTACTCLSQKG